MATSLHASRNGTYSVPQRFGISAILALTTLFAFLFAGLRVFNAPPVVYLFFGTLAVAICLAQMIFGKVPRLSSAAAGGMLLPFWVLVVTALDGSGNLVDAVTITVISSPFTFLAGAFLGYLTGTIMAGFFLLLDLAKTAGHSRERLPAAQAAAATNAAARCDSSFSA